MGSTPVMMMIGLCLIGVGSLILIPLFNYFQQHQPIIYTWLKNKIIKPDSRDFAERMINHYLKKQRLQNTVYIHQSSPLTLRMLLNQAEIEFAQANLNQEQLRAGLETTLEDFISNQAVPNRPFSFAKRSPQIYSRLLCLTLAGYAVATASMTLIGNDNFYRLIHPKVIKKLISSHPAGNQPVNDTNLLKAANPFPWGMINHAFDYWLANSTLMDKFSFHSFRKNNAYPLRDIIMAGYRVGLRHNLLQHFSLLAA